MYENLIGKHGDDAPLIQVLGASLGSAIFTTLVAYPLDLAHGRMAADMSKKPALIKDAQSMSSSAKGNRKSLLMQQ